MSLARVSVPSLLASLTVATLGLALAACSDDGGQGSADASVSCEEAKTHADLDFIQDEIFAKGCSNFSACHQGAARQAGGLNLEQGRSHAALVGIPSSRFDTFQLVVPNQPAQSYLMVVLGQYDGPLDPRIGTMPFNSGLLCKEKRDAIERWIQAGAPPGLDAGVDAL